MCRQGEAYKQKTSCYGIGLIVEQSCTLMRPAKQCTSMLSGTTPLFNWSLTYSSCPFSALILKIPSAYTILIWKVEYILKSELAYSYRNFLFINQRKIKKEIFCFLVAPRMELKYLLAEYC